MKRWILPLTLVAGLAIAGTINIADTYVFQALFRPWSRTTAQLPTASAWTGYVLFNSTRGVPMASDGTDWHSMAPQVGIAKWKFPAIGGGNANYSESATLAITGVTYGDECDVSTDLGMDGGSVALYALAQFSCRAVTNGVVFRAETFASDAGDSAIALPDAGYFARVWH